MEVLSGALELAGVAVTQFSTVSEQGNVCSKTGGLVAPEHRAVSALALLQ